jgi:hypothetical protein
MLVFSNSPRLQQASLSLGDVRVDFDRTTSGTSISNAMFEQRNAGDEEWLGARLGWTGFNWALRRPDGGLMVFRQCGPGVDGDCSIEKWRDADGHLIEFERDFSGILLKIVADDRWISFAYDRQRRISRAWSSGGSEVRYKYDGAGRDSSKPLRVPARSTGTATPHRTSLPRCRSLTPRSRTRTKTSAAFDR